MESGESATAEFKRRQRNPRCDTAVLFVYADTLSDTAKFARHVILKA